MPIENYISVLEARDWINEKKKMYLLDVRTTEKHAENSLSHFQSVPISKVTQIIPQLDELYPILIVSDIDEESEKARSMLTSCGLNAYIVRGGIHEWQQVLPEL